MTSLPNLLTLSRIAAIPLLVAMIYWESDLLRWLALVVYVVACVTDYLDGYLARHMNLVSAIGRFLDPIADKLLVAALIVMLVATSQISGLSVIPAIIILCREILVSGLREYLAEIQVPMPVSQLAKWKTLIQMLALGFLIIGPSGPAWLALVGDVGLWLAAALTLITGYDYLSRGLKHMMEETPGG